MRAEETRTDPQFGRVETLINAAAQNSSREILAATCRRRGVVSTATGPLVVAAVFCLVFLVMGAAFSFSTFAGELEREFEAGSGAVSFIFGCAMALLYAGGLFSGPLADRIGTHWALALVWRSATRRRLRQCSPGSTATAGLRRVSPCRVPASARF